MAILNQKRILNLIPKISAPVTLHVSQGDVGTEIEFTLVKGDELFVNTGNLTASVHGVREDGANFGPFTCTLSGSKVTFPLHSEMTAVKGSALAEIVLVDNGGNKVGSANFGILVEESVFPLGVTYDNDVSVYESILAYVQTIPAQLTNDYTSKINAVQSGLNNEIATRISEDALINTRIDEIIAPSGEAPSAAEVTDARIGADDVTYSNLGTAIRTQIDNLNQNLKQYYGYSNNIATALNSGTDLNNVANGGVYSIAGGIAGTILNPAFSSGGQILIVEKTTQATGKYIRQTVYQGSSGSAKQRHTNAREEWSDWIDIEEELASIPTQINNVIPDLFRKEYETATGLDAGTDLNTIVTDGIYVVSGANSPTLINAPSGISSGCMLEVKRAGYGTPNYDVQLFYSGGSKRIYYRYNWGDTWSDWDSFVGQKEIQKFYQYEQNQIENVYSLTDWKRGGTTKRNIGLMMFSDLHGDTERLENAVNILNVVDSIDAGVFLGDIEDSNQSSKMGSEYVPAFNVATKPLFATMGNHDFHDSKSMSANPYNLAESVSRYMGAMNNASIYSENGFGYYDFATYKIRLIILNQYEYPNANDGTNWTYYGSGRLYQQGQIDWLVSTLNSVPEDYTVIIAQHSTEPADTNNTIINTHYGAKNAGGVDAHATYIGSNGYMNDSVIADIISAYISKGALTKTYTYTKTSEGYTGVSVNADFSEANGKFACLIVGHNHAQAFCTINSTIPVYVNDTSSCKYGWATGHSLIARNQNGYTGNLITVLCVDTDNEYLHFVRIGAERNFFGELYDVVSVPYGS